MKLSEIYQAEQFKVSLNHEILNKICLVYVGRIKFFLCEPFMSFNNSIYTALCGSTILNLLTFDIYLRLWLMTRISIYTFISIVSHSFSLQSTYMMHFDSFLLVIYSIGLNFNILSHSWLCRSQKSFRCWIIKSSWDFSILLWFCMILRRQFRHNRLNGLMWFTSEITTIYFILSYRQSLNINTHTKHLKAISVRLSFVCVCLCQRQHGNIRTKNK